MFISKQRQIAEVMCQMLDSSRLAERFPVARGQLVKLLRVLHPRARLFLEDLAACNMHVLCMAASIPDDDQAELQAASLQLSPSTMGNLLVHAFDAIQTETGDRSIELCGSTGLFDITTILLWLVPDLIAISLRRSEKHSTGRVVDYGDVGRPLLIQSGGNRFEYDDKGQPTSGWKRVPWSSAKTLAIDALRLAAIANSLLHGTAGVLGGVAITEARKWIG